MTEFIALLDNIKPYKLYEDQGHWRTSEPLDTSGLFGFVYLIHNVVDDRYYVGKKYYTRKGVKTRNYKHGTDTNWKTYTGSSAELNLDIAKHGMESFMFSIIKLYTTRGGLSYGEANLQHKYDVLTLRDSNDKPKFYNGNIAGIKYIPKEFGRSA
jgi:hypothetical protein